MTEVNNQAVLSNHGDMTSFNYGNCNIRFRITEEYIDLVPILQNLYIDPKKFLKNIKTVKIGDYE